MPVFTPPETWEAPLLVTAAMMNARLRDKIRELQTGAARGVLGSWNSTAQTDAPSTTFVNVPGWQQTVSVDSPRTLQLVFQGTLNASASGLIPDLITYINGSISARVSQQLNAAGGAGQIIPGVAGLSIPVPAGTVTITAQLRCKYGSGTVSLFSGATMQLIDQGAG